MITANRNNHWTYFYHHRLVFHTVEGYVHGNIHYMLVACVWIYLLVILLKLIHVSVCASNTTFYCGALVHWRNMTVCILMQSGPSRVFPTLDFNE